MEGPQAVCRRQPGPTQDPVLGFRVGAHLALKLSPLCCPQTHVLPETVSHVQHRLYLQKEMFGLSMWNIQSEFSGLSWDGWHSTSLSIRARAKPPSLLRKNRRHQRASLSSSLTLHSCPIHPQHIDCSSNAKGLSFHGDRVQMESAATARNSLYFVRRGNDGQRDADVPPRSGLAPGSQPRVHDPVREPRLNPRGLHPRAQ
ncbi:hypothetical protein QBC39DRAFT_58608 [Podospora conica]|nr:hypothetical protein QBC39DRAFT_58608 [Schizothecium conicum]